MLDYLRFLRLPNLILVALSQVLVRECLILPAFKAEYFITGVFPPHLNGFDFSLLVISTVMLSAAGYMINDYFDVHMDEINRPGKNIVGKKISSLAARNLFFSVSTPAVGIGFYLAVKIGMPVLGFLYVFTAASLWMYSSFYKRRFLSGNILISVLCALSLLMVGLFEPEFYRNIIYLLWYVVPAFLLTLSREILKDAEDMEGDEKSQCKTLPIVLGMRKTKMVVQFIIILTISFLAYILFQNFYTNNVLNFWYLLGIFAIPFAALSYLVHSAEVKKDFYYAQVYVKILITVGILSMVPFWYFFIK